MDFFYMGDLIKLVEHYIREKHLPKHIDCSYPYRYSLDKIANMINNLSDYKVEIEIGLPGHDYIGSYTHIITDYIGLEQGIKETYKKVQWT